MTNKISKLALLALTPFFALIGKAGSNTYNWDTTIGNVNGSNVPTAGVTFYQVGGTTKFNSGFNFEIGTFTAPFTTTAAFAAGFKTMNDASNPAVAYNNAFDGTAGDNAVAMALSFSEAYPTGVSASQQIYAWGYNSKTVASTSQWVIVTNPSWTVTTLVTGAALSDATYSVGDSGTVFVFGSLTGSLAAGKAIAASAVVVPEPSTYASIVGVIAVGFVAVRRRRKV
jgi:hypothetical protein